MHNPTISIITVSFNSLEGLKKTRESVLDQESQDVEHVIVDGGSTDGSIEYIKTQKKSSDVIKVEPDEGIYDAMNKGAVLANGEWLMFLNAGDVFTSRETLKQLKGHLKNASCRMLYGPHRLVKAESATLLRPKHFTFFNLIFWGTRTANHQSILVRKKYFISYNLKLQLKGELDWYFNIVKRYPSDSIFKSDIPIVDYELGGVSDQRIVQNLREQVRVLYNHAGLLSIIGLPILLLRYFNAKFSHQ